MSADSHGPPSASPSPSLSRPMLRADPVSGRWVIIAPQRAERPGEDPPTELPPPIDPCPFCAGNEVETEPSLASYTLSGSARPWDVRVVPNRFPALRAEGEIEERERGIYRERSGVGAHEVFIESAEHLVDLGELPVEQLTAVLHAWRDRIRALREDPRLRCAMVFKNHGVDAGSSIAHVHSQLIALPVVPTRLEEELTGARVYFEAHRRCVFCDMLAQDLEEGERVVYANEETVVIAPYASRSAFEMWMLPRSHEPWYEDATRRGFESLADALHVALRKLNGALDHPPFNLMLHSAPFYEGSMEHYHWHLELIPIVTKVAGFERGTGFYINPTPPEDAARLLREIDPTTGDAGAVGTTSSTHE